MITTMVLQEEDIEDDDDDETEDVDSNVNIEKKEGGKTTDLILGLNDCDNGENGSSERRRSQQRSRPRQRSSSLGRPGRSNSMSRRSLTASAIVSSIRPPQQRRLRSNSMDDTHEYKDGVEGERTGDGSGNGGGEGSGGAPPPPPTEDTATAPRGSIKVDEILKEVKQEREKAQQHDEDVAPSKSSKKVSMKKVAALFKR